MQFTYLDSLTTDKPAVSYKVWLYIVLAIGLLFRIYHFFYNRSLWEDEIYLSAGIINHTLKEILTQPLPYLQKAPLGYVLISRVGVAIFGNNEMGLRIYCLICGIVSLFTFLALTKHFLKPAGQIIAVALLAVAPPLIYHSVEAKPYITELLASIIITLWYLKFRSERSIGKLLLWGSGGAVIVWFCYSSIFILAATGFAAAITYVKHKNWRSVYLLGIPAAMWLISFGISYVLYAKPGSDAGWLTYFFEAHDGYIPLRPVQAVIYLIHHLFSFMHYPLGLSWSNDWNIHSVVMQIITRAAFIPFILFFFGTIYLFKGNKNFIMLLFCMCLISVTASGLKLYPIHERLTTYLAPFGIIVLAAGCQFFFSMPSYKEYVGWVLAALVLFGPIKNSIIEILNPYFFYDYKKSYQREALAYLNDHYQPGDLVYVYWNDLPGYRLYKTIDSLKFTVIAGTDYRYKANSFPQYFAYLNQEFTPLKGKKHVWIIHNSNIDMSVGDFWAKPEWYYHGFGYGVKQFQNWLHANGTEKDKFIPKDPHAINDIQVWLMDFSTFK